MSFKIPNNSTKIEIEIETEKENAVFLTGSYSPPKPSQSTTIEPSYPVRVEAENYRINRYEDISDLGINRELKLRSPSCVCEDEFSGSKESDCAIGSRPTTENIYTDFNDSDSLYWNQNPESNLINDVDISKDLLPVKTEAQDLQDCPVGGSLLEEATKPNQTMSEPYYEEYLDLGGLFPELIPGFDTIDMLPCLHRDTAEKEEPQRDVPATVPLLDDSPLSPSEDIMMEIDDLLQEADLSSIESSSLDELLNVEVVDEAPTDHDQSDLFSSYVSSPGSMVSTSDSCSVTIEDNANVDSELQYLLELLESTDAQELKTIESSELCLESAPKSQKRNLEPTGRQPVVKKQKQSTSTTNVEHVDKVTARRIKNNAASRNCRASRKQREQDLFAREEELLKSNSELKSQVEELTKETEALRKVLIQHLSGTTIVA